MPPVKKNAPRLTEQERRDPKLQEAVRLFGQLVEAETGPGASFSEYSRVARRVVAAMISVSEYSNCDVNECEDPKD